MAATLVNVAPRATAMPRTLTYQRNEEKNDHKVEESTRKTEEKKEGKDGMTAKERLVHQP
jgi:hypothetical protein